MSESLIESSLEQITALREQIESVVLGQNEVIEQTMICVIAAGHALIEGAPGLGKTLLARALAKACGGEFSRIQFTPDLLPADVTGYSLYDNKTAEWRISRGPVFCNFLLADEINRAPAKTQSALLEVMQEQQVTIEGKTVPMEAPFVTLATQNPLEQEGTYPLPEAQLDRFLLKIHVPYPEKEDEVRLAKMLTTQTVGDKLDLSKVVPVLTPEAVVGLQKAASMLLIDDSVVRYAVDVVSATRSRKGLEMGASPRASIALLRAAKAKALINGHSFVTPDDVKSIAPAVLRHRLRLNADFEIEGIALDSVIQSILETTETPRS